jgi:hypothetical protein
VPLDPEFRIKYRVPERRLGPHEGSYDHGRSLAYPVRLEDEKKGERLSGLSARISEHVKLADQNRRHSSAKSPCFSTWALYQAISR